MYYRYDYIPVYTEDEKSAKVFSLFFCLLAIHPNKYFIGFVQCNGELSLFIYFIDGMSHSLRGLLVSLTHLTDTNFIK